MLGSNNSFFKLQPSETKTQRIVRLFHYRKVVERFLAIKKIESELFLEAYDYFVFENPNGYDGATLAKDYTDLPKLELSAMVHDYQYLALLPNYHGLAWWLQKHWFDYLYYHHLKTFGKAPKSVAFSRYVLLRITTPIYYVFKKIKEMKKTTISVKNFKKPIPRWFRLTQRVVYGLFVGALFTSTLQRFGMTDADVSLLSGWIIALMEVTGGLLAEE